MIQRRVDDVVNFDRTWASYKDGFGDANGSFWLGLGPMHHHTNQGPTTLRVDLTAQDDTTAFAIYNTFLVGHLGSNYKLKVEGYCGTAGDDLAPANKRMFTTKEAGRDHDLSDDNCAVTARSGFWHNDCSRANVNGLMSGGSAPTNAKWNSFKGPNALKRIEMTIKTY